MNRIAGITFNANGTEVGFMEYVTGTTKDYHYQIKRYKNEPLENRYFIENEGTEINLSDYISAVDLDRAEKMYQKEQRIEPIVFFIVQLNKWEELDKRLEKQLA
jgi:hypothetical protein